MGAKDSFGILQRCKTVLKTLRRLEERVDRCMAFGSKLRDQVRVIDGDLGRTLQEVRGIMDGIGKCMPSTVMHRPLEAVSRREARLHERCLRKVNAQGAANPQYDHEVMIYQSLAAQAH